MRYLIIKGGVVVNAVEAEPEYVAAEGFDWQRSDDAQIGDLWDGQAFSAPAPNPDAVMLAVEQAVQKRLDDFAATRNYDGILSACTYAASAVTQFKTEGQYCVDLRDQTWSQCYSILGAVQAGQRPLPTVEEVMSELPVPAWPA